jgi:hypothetical protein
MNPANVTRILALIDEQLADTRFTMSERLRTAAFYADDESPIITAEWVEACTQRSINAGTARNRLNEYRRLWA